MSGYKMKNILWFGVYGKPYQGNEPAFFDASAFSWKKSLTEMYPEIRKELSWLIAHSEELTPYFDENLQFPPKNWKTISFCVWGMKVHDNLERFPVTARLLSEIPGLISCSFSLLEPHSRIKPHYGDTNGIFRVHLGIEVPAGLPDCGFRVSGEERAWKEGELLVFLDANVHEAFNDSDKRRYVLIMDIVRPEFMQRKNYLCVKVLSVLTLYWIEAHTRLLFRLFRITAWDQLERIPRWVMDLVFLLPLRMVWFFLLPLRNRVYFKKWLSFRNFP